MYCDLFFKPFAQSTKGPGYWKLNDSILKEKVVKNAVINLWNHTLSQQFPKDFIWWEKCKIEFKKLLMRQSKRIANETRKQIQFLEDRMREYLARSLDKNNQNPDFDKMLVGQIKIELETLFSKTIEGARIRSRAQVLDNAERPSRYFLRVEQQRQSANMINELYDPQTKTNTKNPKRICEIARSFYTELFKMEPVQDEKIDEFLENINLPRLQPHLVEACEGDMTFDEAEIALSKMDNDHSPGGDGLTAAFYKMFFYLFGKDFIGMINDCRKNVRKLPESQRQSLIRLICKDITQAIHLMFYRPISLLNYDYKIIAKVLANRLKYVLSDIISIDQTCSIPGRSIFDNVHLMRDIFKYCEQKQNKCAILSLDKVKAFDRVSHHYMYRVLTKFGFGPDFIEWVKLIYTDIESSVMINGFITQSIKVARSVRQGCPFSMPLYVVQAEPFANRIRRDPEIKGLQICENVEARVSEYADDTNLILTTLKSIEKCLVICGFFEKASGAKLNMDKTCLIGLGQWKDYDFNMRSVKQVTKIKALGLILGHMVFSHDNWGKVLDKYISSLNNMKSRDLGMRGRAITANSQSCSKLWYLTSVIQLPKEYLTMLNSELFKFIWADRKWKPIAGKTLHLSPKEGGIGLVNIELKSKALKIMHIVRLVTHKNYVPKWVHFAIYWVGLSLRKYREEFASNNKPHSGFDFIPAFYYESKIYFEEFMNENPNVILKDLTVKIIYEKLLENINEVPKIIQKNPTHNYKFIWRNVNNKFLEHKQRDFLYKLVHDSLSFRMKLHAFNILDDPNCQFCKNKNVENAYHLFRECPVTTQLWPFVKELFFNLCNHRLKLDIQSLRWCEIPKEHSKKKDRNKYLYITTLAMHTIWKMRCDSGKNGTPFCNIKVKNMFIKDFKERLQVDFYRFGNDKFMETWGKHTILFTIHKSGIKFDF